MHQWIRRRPSVANQPARELLGRPQVVVIGLGTQPVAAELAQELQSRVCRDVANELPLSRINQPLVGRSIYETRDMLFI
jgi:hypothetical protein